MDADLDATVLAADDAYTDKKTDNKKSTKKKKNNNDNNNNNHDKTYKKRTKTPKKPSSMERAYAKYDVAPVVAIDHQSMEGIFAYDDVFFSYAPPAGFADAASSKSSGTDKHQKMKAAKMSYEPHPYLTFGSDSDSVNSLASSSSELSSVVIPLRDDDRNTYRAVTA